MTAVAGLPVPTVEIALSPTSLWVPGTWTDISSYVTDVTTRVGKEHAMDRVETGTCTITMSGAQSAVAALALSIPIRALVKITATTSLGTPNVFYGLVITVSETIETEVLSSFTIDVDDALRMLSLIECRNTQLYPAAVMQDPQDISTGNQVYWWPILDTDNSGYVTAYCNLGPVSSTTSTTFTVAAGLLQSLASGQVVTDGTNVVVVGGSYGAGYTGAIGCYATQGSVSALGGGIGGFAVAWGLYPQYAGWVDPQRAYSGLSGYGAVGFNTQQGVALYDTKTCADMTNGSGSSATSSPSGFLNFLVEPPPVDSAFALDFWVIGAGLNDFEDNVLASPNTPVGSVSTLYVNPQGQLTLDASTGGATYSHPTPIADGFWHHVALIQNTETTLMVDGVPVDFGSGHIGLFSHAALNVGLGNQYLSLGACAGYIDEVTLTLAGASTFGSTPTIDLIYTLQNRYQTGALLRTVKQSGQRIAEILTIAGFPLADYYVDGNQYPFTDQYGAVQVQGLTSTVTANLAADLIGYVEDTESGILVARPDGTLDFLTRQYPIVGPNAAVQLTLDDEGTHPYSAGGFSAPKDDLDTWTQVIVSPTNGIEQVWQGLYYQKYGSSTLRKAGTQHVTNNQGLWLAQFLAHIYAYALHRVESAVIESTTKGGATLATMMAANVWDCYALTRKPQSASRYTVQGMIETIGHDYHADPGTWAMTVAIDPYRTNDIALGRKVAQLDGANFPLYDLPNASAPYLI